MLGMSSVCFHAENGGGEPTAAAVAALDILAEQNAKLEVRLNRLHSRLAVGRAASALVSNSTAVLALAARSGLINGEVERNNFLRAALTQTERYAFFRACVDGMDKGTGGTDGVYTALTSFGTVRVMSRV